MSKYTFDRPAQSPDLVAENVALRAENDELRQALAYWQRMCSLRQAEASEAAAALGALADALRPYLLPEPEYDE